jgi:hypothetical protein
VASLPAMPCVKSLTEGRIGGPPAPCGCHADRIETKVPRNIPRLQPITPQSRVLVRRTASRYGTKLGSDWLLVSSVNNIFVISEEHNLCRVTRHIFSTEDDLEELSPLSRNTICELREDSGFWQQRYLRGAALYFLMENNIDTISAEHVDHAMGRFKGLFHCTAKQGAPVERKCPVNSLISARAMSDQISQ